MRFGFEPGFRFRTGFRSGFEFRIGFSAPTSQQYRALVLAGAPANVDTIGPIGTLRTDLFGMPARATPPSAVIRLTTAYTQGTNDVWAGAGWSTIRDTDNTVHLGAGDPDFTYWTCPRNGRLWTVEFRACAGGGTTNAVWANKISVNALNTGQSIASDCRQLTGGNESYLTARREMYPLNAGDKLYWSIWSATAVFAINPVNAGGVTTEMTIRDVGAA